MRAFLLLIVLSGYFNLSLDIGPHLAGTVRDSIALPNSLEKFDSLYDEAWKWMGSDLEHFKSIGDQIWKISLEKDYLPGKCQAPQIIGTYFYFTGELDSALYYYHLALKYRKIVGNDGLIGSTINNIANVYLEKGEYSRALESYQEALDTKFVFDSLEKAQTIMNIGSVYYLMSDYEKALKYNNQALQTLESSPDYKLEYANCLSNNGSIYKEMNEEEKALEFFHKALPIYRDLNNEMEYANTKHEMGFLYLKTGDLGTSLTQFEEAFAIDQKLQYSSGIAAAMSGMSLVYRIKGEYTQALEDLHRSKEIWEQLGNMEMLAESHLKIGEIHLLQNHYEAALMAFKKAEELCRFNHELEFDIYNGLARAYEGLGAYKKANPYHVKCLSIKDSINTNQLRFKNLEAQYLEDQNKIELLKKEQAVMVERNRKEKIVRHGLLTLVTLLLILAISLFMTRQAVQRKKLSAKEASLKQQALESRLKDQELNSAMHLLRIQDGERKRIAQDLHDRLGSTLSMVKLHFQKTNEDPEELDESRQKSYSTAKQLLDEAVQEVRKISHDLATGVLKDFGLAPALQELKQILEQSDQFKVELITHNMDNRLDHKLEIAVYRTIRELISNIIRHAEASEICIQLIKKQDGLHVEVSDNGRGFVESGLTGQSGIGFQNIKERLSPFGGELSIDSAPGKGAIIFVKIPLNGEK